MTFEEYKELALNPPLYKGGTICRVDVYGYYDEWICDEGGCRLIKAHTSYHINWAEAVSALPKIYDAVKKDGQKIYCALIYEIPTGIDMRYERYTRVASYDAECRLIDQTLSAESCCVNDTELETFRGRDRSMIRFQPGDIVEVLRLYCEMDPYVETAIITKTPPTIGDSWRLYEQLGDRFVEGNESDEYHYLIGEHWLNGYHTSSPAYLVFKPHLPIPKKLKKELKKFYHNFTGQAFWRQGGSRLDKIAQSTGGLFPDMQPGMNGLVPSDFNPIYEASEVEHVFEAVDINDKNPLETMLARIDESSNSVFTDFSNFIICITNTKRHAKRLNPRRIGEWKKTIESKLPAAKSIVWGERIAPGADTYRIDIVAYN